MAATKVAMAATRVSIEWVDAQAGAAAAAEEGTPLPQSVIDSIRDTKVALKGPITTPVGSGFRSVNVALRKELDLYANLRPAVTIPGVRSRYEGVDLVVVRENTEDLYAGVEHMVGADAAESIKIITRAGTERIARFAFDYARREGRRKVTAVHKANIMKLSDGLFLEVSRQVAEGYSDIVFEDRIVDNMCMQLVQKPEEYDVLLCPNLYGDILSDLCAGLVGGLGVAPGANIGSKAAVFEPVHGSAPKYAGLDRADPTALILSGVLMLRHLGETRAAQALFLGVRAVIGAGKRVTYDLGGDAGTSDMGEAVAEEVDRLIG
jgi:isocitrate dehydrogenase (NAD+)